MGSWSQIVTAAANFAGGFVQLLNCNTCNVASILPHVRVYLPSRRSLQLSLNTEVYMQMTTVDTCQVLCLCIHMSCIQLLNHH